MSVYPPDTKNMANIMNFDFQQNPIRVIMVNNKPWFVAKDVCDVLGTKTKDIPAIIKPKHRALDTIDTQGGRQKATIISEAGLYSLIMKSRKPIAEPFQDWVTEEVLPSIRETGSYSVNGSKIPLHLLRYIENENMLPKGHFSVLTEMIRHFYGKLAAMGAPEHELEKMYADISMGIGFSDFLKKQNIDVSTLPTYNHKTPWGKVVPAKAYPLRYAEAFSDYILNEWMPNKAYKYVQERSPAVLEYLPKLLSN